MEYERLLRWMALSLIPLGLLAAVLALALGSLVAAGLFAASSVAGMLGYWLLSRLPTVFDTDFEFDLASRETFVGASLQVPIVALEFGLLAYLVVSLDVVAPASLTPVLPSVALGALGLLPGAFFGAGVPYLTQREVVFHRLNQSHAGRMMGFSLTFGTYVLLLVAATPAGVVYAITYVVSRVLVVVSAQVWSCP